MRKNKVIRILSDLLHKSYATMLENDAIIKEFARQVDKVLTILNGSNVNVIARYLNNETLIDKEKSFVNRYKIFFDGFNEVRPSIEYSKAIERNKKQNYNEVSYLTK